MVSVASMPQIGNPNGVWGESPTLSGEILDPSTQLDYGSYQSVRALQLGATKASIQAAIIASVIDGKEVVFGPGTFNITPDIGQGLSITGNLRLRGAGRNLTFLNFVATPTVASFYGFDILPNIEVTIEDLTVNNPSTNERLVTDASVTSGSPVVTSATANWTSADIGGVIDIGGTSLMVAAQILSLGPGANDVTTGTNSFATLSGQSAYIQGPLTQAFAINRANAGNDATKTRFRRVNITGQWRNAIDNGGPGDSMLEIEDCYFESLRSTISTGGDDGTTTAKMVLLDGVDFHGPFTQNPNGQCHSLYIGPGVALKAVKTRFRNTAPGGYSIHYFGSGINKPAFVIVNDCDFDAGSQGMIAPETAITQVINSRFNNITGKCIAFANDHTKAVSGVGLFVVGCTFVTCGTAVGMRSVDALMGWADVNISECVSIDTSLTDADGTNVNWRISNSKLYFITKVSSLLQANKTSFAGKYEVRNCEFYASASATSAGIRARNGLVKVSGCDFSGLFNNGGTGAIYFDGVGTNPEYIVEDCDFRNTGNAIQLAAGVANGILKGDRNRFATVYPSTPAATYQSLGIRRGLSPTAVASAGSITLPWTDYDTWHITGTTAINTIILGSAAAMRSFNGQIRIIADGLLPLNNAATGTGQILTKTAANRTTAANEVVTLQFDPNLLEWFEVA